MHKTCVFNRLTNAVFSMSLFLVALVLTAMIWSNQVGAVSLVGPGFPCFTGPFESYDKWQAMLAAKLSTQPDADAALATMSERYPRALYEHRKAALECREVMYEVAGNHVTAFVIKPKDVSGKLPVILYNRGGNGSFGSLVFSGEVWDRLMPLAESGFLVMASQYRGGRPLLPRWQTANDEFGGQDVDDVLALVTLAEQMPDADLSKLGVAGHSRGGMMSYLVAKREPRIKAMAALAGSVDLLQDLTIRPEMETVYRERIPNYAKEKVAALRARSALYWVDQLPATLPILIIHGEQDERVPVTNARRMATRLDELQRPHQLLIFPNSKHSLREDGDAVNKALGNWFHQQLETTTVSTAAVN